jgi:hypothetical protein
MMLKIIGRTVDDKLVLAEVYKFYSSTGLPLEMIFDVLQAQRAVPCWMTFVKEAQEAGMEYSRILSRLDEALVDSYGPQFRDTVFKELNRRRDLGTFRKNSWFTLIR